ncbi:MAG: S-adenosylmethionine:tRNA ribosyltransferase-isomerase [Polyangiales bacterium]
MATRMMLVDTATQQIDDADASALATLLDARDLLVVNDAATLPASLQAFFGEHPVEVRLLEGPYRETTRAVLLGAGDYHVDTDHREPPPRVGVGDRLRLGSTSLEVSAVSALSPRLVELRWPGTLAERFALLYRAGRPVQYRYVEQPLALWDVQTSFAARPWAVEMPSAARPLDGALLTALMKRGVTIARLTHAAGLSSTGDPRIDRALPLPERYEIPNATLQALATTRGRVVAVGTSVVRALEEYARTGQRAGMATLVLDEHTRPRIVSGLLTGIHMPGESHYRLLSAFTRQDTLALAAQRAARDGYRLHEFGDAALFLPNLATSARRAAQSSRSGCSLTMRSYSG